MIFKNKRKAFTLIELLVVIVIIGILASLSVVAFNKVRQKSRDTKRVADVKAIHSALEVYKIDEGEYPEFATPGTALVGPTSGITYLHKIPQNPTPYTDGTCTLEEYSYTQTGSGDGYTLDYCLGGEVNTVGPGNFQATPEDIAIATGDGGSGSATDQCESDCGWTHINSGESFDRFNLCRLDTDSSGNLYLFAPNEWPEVNHTLRKWDAASEAWSIVGSAGFNNSLDSLNGAIIATADDISLQVFNNIPYVSFTDGNDKVHVMKYESSSWTELGSTGLSDATETQHKMIVTSNGIFVAFRDTGAGDDLSVVKYNSATDEWDILGSRGFSTNEAASIVVIDEDSAGTLFVGGNEFSTTFFYKYNGTAWVDAMTTTDIVDSTPYYLSGHFDSNDDFIVTMAEGSGRPPQTWKYDVTDDSWSQITGMGTEETYNMVSDVINTNVYSAYADKVGTPGYELVVKKWDGSSWSEISSTLSDMEFSPGCITVYEGIVYIAF